MNSQKVFNPILYLVILLFTFSSCVREEFYNDLEEGFDPQEQSDDEAYDNLGDGEVFLTLYSISGDNIDKIKDYNVPAAYQDLQNDYTRHLQMWDYFTTLIPVEHRINITEFLVLEGNGELGGFVEPIEANDLSAWRMGLAIDAADDLENINLKEEFAAISIHEFGHVLTLNDRQVDASESETSCSNFHTGEGCSNTLSYINELFEIGWSDIYDEFLDTKENKIYTRFFRKYEDRFVSQYAATNPGEDVAEVFTYFVTEENPRTGNSIAAQKINAMYQRPELVTLRNQIRQNPAVRAMNINQLHRVPCKHHKTHRVDFAQSIFK